jgi:hypothetical protein
MKRLRLSLLVLLLPLVLWGPWALAGAPAGTPLERIATLEETVASLSAVFDDVLPQTVPAGTIVVWSGSADAVPEGWAICDGQNATPDLRDRFVMGATNLGELGETGGTTEHQHVVHPHQHEVLVPYHTHEIPGVEGLSTSAAGEHEHVMEPDSGPGIIVDTFSIGGVAVAKFPHTHQIFPAGEHTHDLDVPSVYTLPGEGSEMTSLREADSESATHLPPYYQTAFLMKLPAAGVLPTTPSSPPAANPVVRIAELEAAVAQLSSAIDEALRYAAPPGLVVMWSGPLGALPEGWALCDGTNGTPDLRGRFIRGATDAEPAGTRGGSRAHNHSFRGHQHDVVLPLHDHIVPALTVALVPTGEHQHELEPASGYVGVAQSGLVTDVASRPGHTHQMSAAGEHTHDVLLPERVTTQAEGVGRTSLAASTSDSAEHIPPYYKLVFIAKLALAPWAGSRDDHPAPPPNPIERIAALEETVASVQSALAQALPFLVPAEAIAAWPGSAGAVPDGWAPCDGEHGTPDLRGLFLLGAATATGERGGSESHVHAFGPHTHLAYFPHSHSTAVTRVRTDSSPFRPTGHGHEESWAEFLGADWSPVQVDVCPWIHGHLSYYDPTTEHEHDLDLVQLVSPVGCTLSAETSPATSSMLPAEHLPPYETAIWVMKLDEAE